MWSFKILLWLWMFLRTKLVLISRRFLDFTDWGYFHKLTIHFHQDHFLQTQPGCWLKHLLRIKTLCGKIRCSKSRNPARMCMHATSFHQLPKHHFKLRLIVDTGGIHPNMIRENFIVNSRWGSESIEPGSLHSAGMQQLMRSQSTNRLSSHYPVQSPSVCHKHVPISQLRNCLLSLVPAFDCIAPSSKNNQTGCFAFRHTSWGYFTDQFMWFIFSIGGISSIPPCVDNVESVKIRVLARRVCYKRKCRIWVFIESGGGGRRPFDERGPGQQRTSLIGCLSSRCLRLRSNPTV